MGNGRATSCAFPGASDTMTDGTKACLSVYMTVNTFRSTA